MRSERAFTLLEVMVSLFIFSVVLGGVLPAFLNQVHQNNGAEIKIGAMQAAQLKLDEIRANDISTLPTSGQSSPAVYTIDGRTFTVIVYYCLDASYCTSSDDRYLEAATTYNGTEYARIKTFYTQLF